MLNVTISISENTQECPTDTQMMKENTNAQTESSLSHTSIAITPSTNVITAKYVRIRARLAFVSDARTEDAEIPPIGDILVSCHETSVDIRLFRERTSSLSPDMLAVVEKGVHDDGGD
jgi:hypothetical protein